MRKQFGVVLLSMAIVMPQVNFALQASSTATSTSAMTSQSNLEKSKSSTLSEVIIKVKSQVEVPESLTEFDYSEEGEDYDLSWNDPLGKNWLQITCNAEGNILNYYYGDNTPYSYLATVDYETAKENSEAFLEKVASSYVRELVLESEAMPIQSDTYEWTYDWVHDGVKVFDQKVSIEVSKQTGEVVRFSGLNYDAAARFSSSSPALTLEQAQKLYLSQIGIDLQYRIAQDYEEEPTSFLIYSVNNLEGKGISAATGKVIENYKTDKSHYKTTNAESTTANIAFDLGESMGLSPAERQAVEERKEFMTPEKIVAKASALFPILKDMKIVDSSLSKVDQVYRRTIEFQLQGSSQDEEVDSATLCVNAVTGEVIRYDYNTSCDDETPGKAWTTNEAKNFLKSIAKEQYEEVILDSETIDDDKCYQRYSFGRRVNDILVSGNSLSITYNTHLQQVTRYYKNWTETSFKSAKGALSEEAAVKKIGIELVYMQVGASEYALAYNHENRRMMLDAYSGEKVDYKGEVIVDKVNSVYTDVAGNPYEEAIMKLYYSGVYFNTQKLCPNKTITQGEMLSLLAQATGEGSEQVYRFTEERGMLSQEEEDPDATLTKEEGIKLLVSATAYGKLAKVTSIYQYPYQDQDVTEDLKGYIAVAYGMNWLSQDAYLKPKADLTKAEAMAYIYRALDVLSGAAY